MMDRLKSPNFCCYFADTPLTTKELHFHRLAILQTFEGVVSMLETCQNPTKTFLKRLFVLRHCATTPFSLFQHPASHLNYVEVNIKVFSSESFANSWHRNQKVISKLLWKTNKISTSQGLFRLIDPLRCTSRSLQGTVHVPVYATHCFPGVEG